MPITGTENAETLEGTEFNDTIQGLGGNDTLYGYDGNDTLDGGAGDDVMVGGLGDDTYWMDSAGDTIVEGKGEGNDLVYLGFNFVASSLHANFEVFALYGAGVKLSGNSLANELRANVTTGSTLYGRGGDDKLVGSDHRDLLYGGPGDDTLLGGMGEDVLDGSTGADVMWGGGGNDSYVADDYDDSILEFSTGGYDVVRASVDFTLHANVEELRLRGGASRGSGNIQDNTIFANTVDSVLYGYSGADRLFGHIGDDQIFGGDGNDRINGAAGNDRLYGGADNDTITGGTGDDTIWGDAGADKIGGEDGNDVIWGGWGDDRLYGGEGADTISGGANRDVMEGGAGADTFVFGYGDFAGLVYNSADRITDFDSAEGDKIDLAQLFANYPDGATFLGTDAFSGAEMPEIRYDHVSDATMVYIDMNGDAVADHAIRLDGTLTLSESDFAVDAMF